MIRTITFALAVVLALTGCDLIKKVTGKGGDGDNGSSDTSDDGKSSSGGKATAGCKLEGTIEADVTVKKGCTVNVTGNVGVQKGATLRIEEGATIKMCQSCYLWIYDGKLVAKGTEKAPITFTSANKTTAAGDWVGLGFEDKAQAGTELDYVHIDWAGANESGGKGAITISGQRSPKRITLSNVEISSSAQAAVEEDSELGGFAKFEKNVFKKNKISADLHAAVLATVGAGNTFSDPIHVHGNIDETATWPAVDVPVFLDSAMEVGGEKSPATLTIPAKTVVKVDAGGYVSVGTKNGGGLIANGVTFTSANASPHAGDWVGIFLYDRASNVSLDGATIAYAGQEASGGSGAITFYGPTAKKLHGVKIANVTFTHCATAAMSSSDHDCGPFANAGNKVDGNVPLCKPE